MKNSLLMVVDNFSSKLINNCFLLGLLCLILHVFRVNEELIKLKLSKILNSGKENLHLR